MCIDVLNVLTHRDHQGLVSRLYQRLRLRADRRRQRRLRRRRQLQQEQQQQQLQQRHDAEYASLGPCFEMATAASTPTSSPNALLTIDRLLAMSPVKNGVDLVGRACRHLFISCVKSEEAVRELFFAQHPRDRNEDRVDFSCFDFEQFAVLYVCQAITKIKDHYGIHLMLDEEKVDQHMVESYMSPLWKKVGFSLYTVLFPDLVQDPESLLPFRAFMEDDSRGWAQKLYDRIRDSQWLYSLVRPVVQGQTTDSQYNREINTLFVKLHLLDPTIVFQAYSHLRKALPDLNMELVTTNYLGEPFDWKEIRDEVEAQIYRPTLPSNAPKFSLEDIELYYGVQVTEFIMQVPRELGLWTGEYPDNKRVSTFRDRCIIM